MIRNRTLSRACSTKLMSDAESFATFGSWCVGVCTTWASGTTISPPNAVPTATIASGLPACCA